MRGPDESGKPDGALAPLLELEGNVADRLARARTESQQLVAAAREWAELEERRLPDQLAADERELAARLDTEYEAELSRLREVARRDAAAYDTAEPEQIGPLVDALVEQLVDTADPTDPGRGAA